jgi:hypothetical protein
LENAAAGAVFSSHLHIDAAGREVGRVHKRGLTASEAASSRPAARAAGRRWAAR